MKEQLLENINNPESLEQLYRKDKEGFRKAFEAIYPLQPENANLQFWQIRLHYQEEKISVVNNAAFKFILLLILVAGLIANISNIPGINKELFFTRNTSFIIIPFLSMYYIWKQALSVKIKAGILLVYLLLAAYVNCLPNNDTSSSLNLIYIHLPILMWFILGFSFLGNQFSNNEKRINYLKLNGDFLIMSGIILLSCFLFTGVTMGLFDLIGIKIEKFYFQYIAIWAIGGIPILANYLIDHNPQIINKVSPIIAKIFTPLAFVNLFIYLATLMYTGKYPHNDRNLLLIYNALLVGVLALIFFSIAETGNGKRNYFSSVLLLGLSVLTIIINGIAVWAICFRIAEWGFTPNRVAVLGGNIIIFLNLIMVSVQLLKSMQPNGDEVKVEQAIAKYLPVYAIWTAIVVFVLPILFQWK
jgi:hypothetical protein